MKNIVWLALLFLMNCDSCQNKIVEKQEVSQNDVLFFLGENEIKNLGPFSYSSKFELVLGQQGKASKESVQSIEIDSDGEQMLLRKTIDGYHFIEVFKDKSEYFTKSQNNPWHSGDGHMLALLMKDSLNLAHFMAKELALVKENDQKKLLAKDAKVFNTPLVKNFSEKPHFSKIKVAKASYEIDLNDKMLPIMASFFVDIVDEKEHFVKIKASMAMNPLNKKLMRPLVEEAKVIYAPVNVSSRFNQLLELELSK